MDIVLIKDNIQMKLFIKWENSTMLEIMIGIDN